MKKKILIYTLLSFLIDRLIKIIVVNELAYGQVNSLITNFFYLTRVNNYGAAWSIMNGNRLFLITVGIAAIISIYHLFIKDNNLNKFEVIIYSLLLGGIIGNLIDRIFLGYVIDYIGFLIFEYKFPIFNLADVFIVVSVFLISINILKEGGRDGKNNSN